MKIYYDVKKTKEINDALVTKWYDLSKSGGDTHAMEEHESTPHGYEYHVSTIIYCPMKYICKRMGFERKFTREAIGVMFIGIVAQKLIQWLYPPEEREYESVLMDAILGHIDVYEKKLHPIEIKASRKKILKPDDLPHIWVNQLVTYMTMENARIGWIIIVNPITCKINVFCITMTYNDVQGTLDEIYERVNHLDVLYHMVSKESPDWGVARIQPDEYEYCDYKKKCPQRKECKIVYKNVNK